jgi:GAF domain-containing protein
MMPDDSSPSEVTRAIEHAPDVARMIEVIRECGRDVVGAQGVTFVLREGDECRYVDEDAIAPLWKGQRFPMAQCISGWVMEHRQTAVIPDIYADARIPVDAYRPTFVRSLVMTPIGTGESVAALGAYWDHTHSPTEDQISRLQALADAAALVLERHSPRS